MDGPEIKKLKAHVFVCTNERAPGHPRGCCKEKGSEKILATFKDELAKRGLKASIRAQKAGCLDTCEWGATVVVYPEGIWYGRVTAEDVSTIVEDHLIHGKPVDRLRIPGK